MFMPIKAMAAPPVFWAAIFMASPWAPTRWAAARVGSVKAALRCSSFMVCSSSSLAVTLATPKDTISIPRRSRHFLDSTSFSASASSMVWPGSWE